MLKQDINITATKGAEWCNWYAVPEFVLVDHLKKNMTESERSYRLSDSDEKMPHEYVESKGNSQHIRPTNQQLPLDFPDPFVIFVLEVKNTQT